jgi:hypothetical protein
MECNVYEVNKNISLLGEPIDRKKWSMFPQIVNAYYNPLLNEIVFPAGIMQRPFFSEEYEDAVNYARMGAVIGHELTHGFDDMGSKFSADGRMINWWTEEDKDEFDTHVDVVSTKNAGRYLSFQWYLNDVSEDGETEFTELDFKIKPKKGALLMFPPVWMFPHKGNLLNSGKKYILSSYLLYPEPVLKEDEEPQLPKFKLFEGFQ